MTYDTINDAMTIAGNGEGTLLAGRYRIVRQLGQGGMGSVWLAEDTQLDNKPFAIKMLPAILVSNKRAYRQLKDEALVAMKLTHPNIVTLRAFEENNGNPFLVMDYIDGQTLDDYLAEHTLSLGEAASRRFTGATGVPPVASGLPEADVLRILRPIAAALDYAHAKGVVHRDVKPGNVMIAKDGTPYILDFGIAREIQETLTRVTGKLSSGTLLYMSPEQLNGDQPKPAQDVYSFAAMVYECLKGEPPFVRGQIEHQILNNPPPPLDLPTTGPSARGSGTLAASVMAGLAKKPEHRPASCMAVLEGKDFSRVEHVERVDGDGGARRPAEPGGRRVPTPPQSGGPRSRAAVKGILAAALLAVLAGGVWWWLGGRNGTTGTSGTTGTNVVHVSAVPSVSGVSSSASPKPVSTPRPISPKAGPTDADVKEIADKAENQEKLINERIDDSQGYFKTRKDELAQKLAQARKDRNDQCWAEAAQGFTNYVNGCKELLELNKERQTAKESKAKAEAAKDSASDAKASQYAEKLWKEASELLKEANDLVDKRFFVDAATKYAAAVKQFELCVDEAKAKRERLEEARERAMSIESEIVRDIEPELKRFKAEDCAQTMLVDGNNLRKEGNVAISRGDFTEAEGKLKQAKEKLAAAAKDAKDYRVDTPLRCAREHTAASCWQQCIDECDKVLGWDSENAEAKRLKAEAEGHLVPMAEIAVVVDGRPLGAGEKVKIGDTVWTTPIRWGKGNIEEGKTYGGKVSYERGGRRHVGMLENFTVDWRCGARPFAVTLKEYTEPRNGECRTFTLPGGVKMEMIYVAPGSFTMGSSSGEADETPHQVRITKPYWIGKYPVTQAQWKALVRANGVSFEKGEPTPYFSRDGKGCDTVSGIDTSDFPMESISWNDCDALVKALNRNATDGRTYAIPTEAQWEFAAKGGKESRGYKYSGGNNMDALGWCYENSGVRRLSDSDWRFENVSANKCRTHSVREKDVGNELGIVGMSGNVWEWCADLYDKDYYTKSPTDDPCNTASGDIRVLRGGSWIIYARDCRSANRFRILPGYRIFNYGFRLCCSAGPRGGAEQ